MTDLLLIEDDWGAVLDAYGIQAEEDDCTIVTDVQDDSENACFKHMLTKQMAAD